jgi:5'(3')-deoxyribonucleotidase
MERIAIDMDGVMADTLSAELAWFRERYGYRWTRADLLGKDLFRDVAAPEHVAAHDALLREGSFFGDLPVMPGAIPVVRELARRHQVFVASAATEFPGSMAPKLRWLARHFPFIPAERVVFCGDKSIVAADVLIDDNAHRFPGFRGRRLLFDAPHNAGVTGCTRVGSWSDVARLLLEDPVAAVG